MSWECANCDKVTCQHFVKQLKCWRTRLCCTGHYVVYQVLLWVGQRYTGRKETQDIQRDNARQRHWLARFRQGCIVVSKAKCMEDTSIALSARFGGSARIGDLLSMLA